jgi:WD40 repeat protein
MRMQQTQRDAALASSSSSSSSATSASAGRAQQQQQEQNWIETLAFSPDGRTLAVGTHGMALVLIDVNADAISINNGGSNTAASNSDDNADVNSVNNNNGGATAANASASAAMYRPVTMLTSHNAAPVSIDWSADGRVGSASALHILFVLSALCACKSHAQYVTPFLSYSGCKLLTRQMNCSSMTSMPPICVAAGNKRRRRRCATSYGRLRRRALAGA